MNQSVRTTLQLTMLFFGPFLIAQQSDSLALTPSNTQELVIPAVQTDSAKTEKTNITEIDISSTKIDGEIPLTFKGNNGEFQLKDLEEASKYDSLWLTELHKSAE